jgi:hypothetical protein
MKQVSFSSSTAIGPVVARRRLPTEQGVTLSSPEAARIIRGLHRDANRTVLLALYELAGGATGFGSNGLSDAHVISFITAAVESGRIVLAGLTIGAAASSGRPTNPLAKVAREIMAGRDAIVFERHRYRLIEADVSLRSIGPDYHPLERVEALRVARLMATQLATNEAERSRWAKVVAFLEKPPEGRSLRLWRYAAPATGHLFAASEPAATPSQLRPKVAVEDWIEIQILYEDGTPYNGPCDLELPDGRMTHGAPGAEGIIRVDRLTPGACKLSFPELDGAGQSAG